MGKVCVITGASQGIGRAAAVRMSREPTVGSIVLVARNGEGLDGTVAEMDRDGKRIEAIPYDLMDLDGIPALVDRIQRDYGGIDILLNIAGYADPRSLLDTSTRQHRQDLHHQRLRDARPHPRGHPPHVRPGRPRSSTSHRRPASPRDRAGWRTPRRRRRSCRCRRPSRTSWPAAAIKIYSISPGRTATELRRKLAPEEDPSTIMQPGQVADVIAQLMSDDEVTLDGQNIIVRTRA